MVASGSIALDGANTQHEHPMGEFVCIIALVPALVEVWLGRAGVAV